MAVTINGNGTITGIAVGGLPDGIVDNGTMADDAIAIADLAATGTASATTFLRGDNSWQEAGGGAWNFISSQTVSGTPSYVTFESGISSTYKNYIIMFTGVTLSSGGYNYVMQVGTGSTYTTSSNYNWANITNNGTANVTAWVTSGATAIRLANGVGVDAGRFESITGLLHIYNIFEATDTEFTWDTVTGESSTKRHIRSAGSGGVELNTSFNNIRFGPTGGTHTAGGRFTLYGISES